MGKVFLTLAFTLAAAVCAAKNIKTVVLTTTPIMHCESCENKIKGNLRFEKGVKQIDTNIEKQTVTVKYDADKTSEDKLCKAFGKFGYEAKKVDCGSKESKGSECHEAESK